MKKWNVLWFFLLLPPFLAWKFPLVKVKTITLTGVPHFYKPLVQKKLEPLQEQNFFLVHVEEVQDLLASTPFVIQGMEKKMPHTVILHLQPRKACSAWKGKWWDAEGIPVDPLLSPPPPIIIKGECTPSFLALVGTLCKTSPSWCSPGTTIVYGSPFHLRWKTPTGMTIHLREEQLLAPFLPDELKKLSWKGDIDLRLSQGWILSSSEAP